jgi:hypothetical protein
MFPAIHMLMSCPSGGPEPATLDGVLTSFQIRSCIPKGGVLEQVTK